MSNHVSDTSLYGIVDINDDNFKDKLIKLIKEFGVVVIKNVINKNDCDTHVQNLVNDIEKITDVKANNEDTWTTENLPRQTRPGLFKEVLCNTPTSNTIRYNENIIKIFKTYYESIKNEHYNDDDLVVSNDGINIKPGSMPPYDDGRDWPHLDQNDNPNEPYKCIQGQMVLTNTSAGFRASPKSHMVFEQTLNHILKRKNKNNFLVFEPKDYQYLNQLIEEVGGKWQIPIYAEKGDFIIWLSSVIHSAILQKKPEKDVYNDNNDRWHNWRAVIYVCYRPRDEFTEKELYDKYNSFLKNGATNHWGTDIVKMPQCNNNKFNFSPKIIQYIQNPKTVYDIDNMTPNLTEIQKKMMGKND